MSVYKILVAIMIMTFPIKAFAGFVVSNATDAISKSIDPRYSDASQKAAQAFFIQSGIASGVDGAEDDLTKETVKRFHLMVGDRGVLVAGAAAYISKVFREQKIVTRLRNPLMKQTHGLSIGLAGVELSDIRTTYGTSHWIKIETRRGEEGRYSTGLNFSF